MLRQLALFGNAQDHKPAEDGKRSAHARPRGFRWNAAKPGPTNNATPHHNASTSTTPLTISAAERAAATAAHIAQSTVSSSVIDAIRAINPSIDPAYLARFEESALRLYLAHLESSRTPRGRGARWERPGDTRAIRVCRPPEET